MNKTPAYLITGFLGSGKTTLIKRILDNYSLGKRVAVIQNEFASNNFDGKELKRHATRDFELLEINNGSVFCICLLSGFVQSLERFVKEYQPDVLLIETSGLSDPISVGEIFNSPQIQDIVYLAGSVCIIDSTSFMKLEKLQKRMVHQVQVADTIIINKIDLTDNHTEIRTSCKSINPQAVILESSYCNIDLNEIFLNKLSKESSGNTSMRFSAEDMGRPDIISAVLKTTKPMKADNLRSFARYIAPKTIRMKGYLVLDSGMCEAIHCVMGEVQTESLENPVKQTELIAMGYELTARDLKQVYEKYC
jgi:G3E family GTPase